MHRRVELQDLLGNIVLRAQAEGEDPAARIDLSKCELCILAKVVFGGPLEVQDLREGLSLPPSTLTGVIGGLEDKKLVRREANPKDRRRVVVHATDEELARMPKIVQEMHKKSGLTKQIRMSEISVAWRPPPIALITPNAPPPSPSRDLTSSHAEGRV